MNVIDGIVIGIALMVLGCILVGLMSFCALP